MGLFVSSQTFRTGVFARETPPPSVIRANATGVKCLVGQTPWGPGAPGAGIITEGNIAELLNQLAPAGFSRSGTAILDILSFPAPTMKFIRVIGSGAVRGTVVINKAGPTLLLTLTVKHYGVAGNSIVWTTAAPTDGDANHFDLTGTMTGTNGTTTETWRNLNASSTGTIRLPSAGNADPDLDTNRSLLLGTAVPTGTGVPLLQNWTTTGGSDGSVAATQYTGTAGTGDAGIALSESDKSIRQLYTDDCGNSLRASVNAAIKTNVDTLLDRIGYISGNSGQTAAQARTDAASYVSANIVYSDVWANVYDDNRVKTIVPSHYAAACLAANLSPSTSIAWRDQQATRLLTNIIDLESNHDSGAEANTLAGVATLLKIKGGFSYERGVVTLNLTTPSKGEITRTAMGIYIASSVVDSLGPNVAAPNVPLNWSDIVTAIDGFLAGLRDEREKDPNNLPYIDGYLIKDLRTSNPQAALDAGQFTVAADIKIGSAMYQIFFNMRYGQSVQILAA